MSSPGPSHGFIAASRVLQWLRAYHGQAMPEAVDLDLVREMLPSTPYGQGVREIKPPMAATWSGCEGALVRNPNDSAEWGIFYNPDARPERRRFTVAHELGHFVLHRDRQPSFNGDKASVHLGLGSSAVIEREADDFASNLLMPGDVLRERIASHRSAHPQRDRPAFRGVVRGAVHPFHQVH